MKLCLIVYKIDARMGSENATGYHLARELVRQFPDTTLISRHNNIALLQADPAFQNVSLIGADVPRYLSFYKKKGRGIILYYYLWQKQVGRLVKKLDQTRSFDVIHQLNFNTDWAPHFLTSQKAGIIWGPLMHHAFVPFAWFPKAYKMAYLSEIVKICTKYGFWFLNPALKKAMRRSKHILFGHPDMPASFAASQKNITVASFAGSHWTPPALTKTALDSFNLLFIGRFVTLKGPHLALDAYALFVERLGQNNPIRPHLTLIGNGPLENHLSERAASLRHSYADCVTVSPWLPREKLPGFYREADYLIYPSLEAQGLVVSEAISQYCPVITLSGTGPAFITQHPALTVSCRHADYRACVKALADKLTMLYDMHVRHSPEIMALRQDMRQKAQQVAWAAIAKKITMFYP